MQLLGKCSQHIAIAGIAGIDGKMNRCLQPLGAPCADGALLSDAGNQVCALRADVGHEVEMAIGERLDDGPALQGWLNRIWLSAANRGDGRYEA